jgi:hypothetical protein
MKIFSGISRQLNDLLAYVLIPGIALVTTASFSRRVLRRVSAWDRFMGEAAEAAFRGACKHVDITDEKEWKRRWKQVELLDVRDLYLMVFGRSGAVMAEIDQPRELEVARNRVMVGMHWGPAISILRLLALSEFKPAFVYRPPELKLLFVRPFCYLYSRLVSVYLSRTLADRAVPIGGAGGILQRLLKEDGTICVLMDSPLMQGRPAASRMVLGKGARLNVGFPALLADSHREYVLYAMNLQVHGSLRKRLELSGPFGADNPEEFLDNYATFLDQYLSGDSPQWRIWHAESQFWNDAASNTGPMPAFARRR